LEENIKAQTGKFTIYVFIIHLVFIVGLYIAGYFKIGLISDDYLNFYDAMNSTLSQKITGQLPFTNAFHIRPVYYLSLEKSAAINNMLGFAYDNFTWYRVQNLIILLLISFICGKIILHTTKRLSIAVIGALTVIIFPNNLNDICWTAGRVDLLCTLFYVISIYLFYMFLSSKNAFFFIGIFVFFILALLTKEIAITLPAVVLLLLYFRDGKKGIAENKKIIINLFGVLALYAFYKFVILGNNLIDIATLYQPNPLSNAPGVFARGLIALTIPLDFLTLNLYLQNHNKIVLLYLLVLYGAIFYLIWAIVKMDNHRYLGQIALLIIVMILPYTFIGYIRPQMILLPFVIVMIHLLWVYGSQKQMSNWLNKKILRSFYAATVIFWGYWSYNVVNDWLISYEKGKLTVDNLINMNIDPAKHTIIIGNPGRFNQTLMFDKITGSYNYWKEKQFTIKDTIVDLVQTGSLSESTIGAKLNLRTISTNEFEIRAVSGTQFFYIEGLIGERLSGGFKNKDMEVEFTEFDNMNKPVRMRLKILSDNVNCYLAENLSFVKIY
jgi:hypothetical protein